MRLGSWSGAVPERTFVHLAEDIGKALGWEEPISPICVVPLLMISICPRPIHLDNIETYVHAAA